MTEDHKQCERCGRSLEGWYYFGVPAKGPLCINCKKEVYDKTHGISK